MAAPATITVTFSPREKVFAPAAAAGAAAAAAAPVPSGSSDPAAVEAAAEVEMLEARRTVSVETAAAAALDASAATAASAAPTALDASAAAAASAAPTALDASAAAAAVSAALDAQAETVSSTLMGIALLAYLQGSAAKHEASGAGGGYGSTAAPSSSQGGVADARPVAHPHERLPPRRYQRMSPVDVDASIEPLTRTLAAIKASQSKAQYTCKRCEKRGRGVGWGGEENEGERQEREKKGRKGREEEQRTSSMDLRMNRCGIA